MRLLFPPLLALVLLLPTAPAPASESHWQHVTYATPEQLETYLDGIDYTLDNWRQGDRSVPRLYLTHIPARWRKHYAGKLSTADKKRYFFFIVAPMVLRANEIIAAERTFLQQLQQRHQWTPADISRLKEIAEEYQLDVPTGTDDDTAFNRLLRRVDAVPPSLALAQAAIESGWGTSRFADEGNALFGQWTWGEDAIAPAEIRQELGNYGIRAFKSPFESVTAYMHNLNTHNAYRQLRDLRERNRQRGRQLSGLELAEGLSKYSERGEVYVREVQTLIRANKLAEVDKAYLRDGKSTLLEPVGEGI